MEEQYVGRKWKGRVRVKKKDVTLVWALPIHNNYFRPYVHVMFSEECLLRMREFWAAQSDGSDAWVSARSTTQFDTRVEHEYEKMLESNHKQLNVALKSCGTDEGAVITKVSLQNFR